jgi:hypothetical protein
LAPSRERFFVFYKDNQIMNVVEHGPATRAKAKLIERGGSGSGFDLQLDFQEKTFKFPVKYKEENEYPLDGLPDWRIRIKGYYPNFVMRGKIPDTLDDNPINPAAFFELIGPDVKGMPAVKNDPIAEANGIAFYLGADGTLRYLVKKGSKKARAHGDSEDENQPKATYTSGEVKLEAPIPVSWAM